MLCALAGSCRDAPSSRPRGPGEGSRGRRPTSPASAWLRSCPALSADPRQGACPQTEASGKACSAAAPHPPWASALTDRGSSLLASKFSTTLPADLRLNESREQREVKEIFMHFPSFSIRTLLSHSVNLKEGICCLCSASDRSGLGLSMSKHARKDPAINRWVLLLHRLSS